MFFFETLAKLAFAISLSTAYAKGQVTVDVTLSPAGSFAAETASVTGSAYMKGDSVVAENVEVNATTLKTGISLRDDHLKKRLMTEKFPKIKLVKAVGKGGKGKGIIEIMGKKKNVAGTYEVEGNVLKAQFKMSLQELNIKDVRYMGVGVKDEVTVNVSLPISSAPPARAAASAKKRK